MRRLLSMLLLIGGASGAYASEDAVPKFERLVKEAVQATDSTRPVYLNKSKQLWAKRKLTTGEVSYDVKKTDSLVNPIVGIVTFNLIVEQSDFFPTKEKAEASTALNEGIRIAFKVALTYHLKNGAWAFAKGSQQGQGIKQWFDFDEQAIIKEPNAVPLVAVAFWLPK